MLYDIEGHALLSGKFKKLPDDDTQAAYQGFAELLLGLRPPAYTDQDAEDLKYAIVSQVNFLLEQDLAPEVLESVSNSQPGTVTHYHDRYRSQRAYAIVQLVTGVKQVRFEVPGRGA